MSDRVPEKGYVYQPEPDGSNGGAIFAVSGPGTRPYRDYRFFTREDAQAVADSANEFRLTSAAIRALGRTPQVQSDVRKHGGR